MNEPAKKITREEFYQRVWTTPIVKLGKQLGYSYLEMVRLCTRLDVPRPSGGYWYRLTHGGTSEQVPLPPAAAGVPAEIELGNTVRFADEPEPALGVSVDPSQADAGKGAAVAVSAVEGGHAKPEVAVSDAGKKREVQAAAGGKPRVVTRRDLYDLVWSKTLKAVAAEFGSNYVELSRICELLHVPKPPNGHWTRVGLGLAVERTPLPQIEPGAPTEATFGAGKPSGRRAAPAAEPTGGVAARTESDQAAPRETPARGAPEQEKDGQKERQTPHGKVVYSRKELYEAIWSTPCQVLAKTLGISDVGLAKTCRRLGIPRPTRGYWARIAAGQVVEKRRLPPAAEGQDQTLTFDVAANAARREELAQTYISVRGLEELAVELELPKEGVPLHPLAQRHREALVKSQAGEDALVRLRKKELFQCEVAPASIGRLCRALHALIEELEARGFKFRGSPDNHDTLRVVKKEDWVSLSCSEEVERLEREPTEADKRRPSWTWQLNEAKATGRFSFGINAWGLKGRRAWTETETRSLGEVLGILVEKVDGVFQRFEEKRRNEAEEEERRVEQQKRWEIERAEQEKQRAQQRAEQEKRREEEEKQRQELERLKRHTAKLKEIEEGRRQALVAAARQWADSLKVAGFIEVCEGLWRKTGKGELSKAQLEWLKWARTECVLLSPLGKGYPCPGVDGAFNPDSVPVGGPYPSCRRVEGEEPVECQGC